jgi:hypothetical protein
MQRLFTVTRLDYVVPLEGSATEVADDRFIIDDEYPFLNELLVLLKDWLLGEL